MRSRAWCGNEKGSVLTPHQLWYFFEDKPGTLGLVWGWKETQKGWATSLLVHVHQSSANILSTHLLIPTLSGCILHHALFYMWKKRRKQIISNPFFPCTRNQVGDIIDTCVTFIHKNNSNTARFVVYTMMSANNIFGKTMRKKGLQEGCFGKNWWKGVILN